jgi:type I restriction enzyme S subunit
MEATLIEKLSIEKSNWTPVKFGDVAFEPKETSNNPLEDGIEHVVGLEHIETQNIHLRNSAGIAESTTFTKRFAIGDVLFGRRRAYLKKAAQASFSGICSGDITVFRAKKNLLPELLPFIVGNERFFDYAIKHSAGGLSPRVKFKDLANYEFLLPPKNQQAQLAELLWAMDEVVERENGVLERIINVKEALVKEKCLKNSNGVKFKLNDVIDHLEAGVSVNSEEGILSVSDFGILKTSSVSEGYFIPSEVKKVVISEVSRLKAPVRKNTIIISRMNTMELAGANAFTETEYKNLLRSPLSYI